MQRTLIIGDVHGCLHELQELLDTMNYSAEDRLIFVGDLIQRGPHSLETLRYVRSLDAEVVCGNWELAFIRYMEGAHALEDKFRNLLRQMGPGTMYWLQWIRSFPMYIEGESFLVVHGGLVPDEHPSQSEPYLLANLRTWDGKGEDLDNPHNPPWYELYNDNKLVVFGHWARQGLLVRDNVIGLDSGCVYGNRLSGLELPSRIIHQVESHETYRLPSS